MALRISQHYESGGIMNLTDIIDDRYSHQTQIHLWVMSLLSATSEECGPKYDQSQARSKLYISIASQRFYTSSANRFIGLGL